MFNFDHLKKICILQDAALSTHPHITYSLFCETLHLCSLYVVLSPENLHSFAKHPFILSRKSKIVVLCGILGQKKSAEMDGVIDQSILQQS